MRCLKSYKKAEAVQRVKNTLVVLTWAWICTSCGGAGNNLLQEDETSNTSPIFNNQNPGSSGGSSSTDDDSDSGDDSLIEPYLFNDVGGTGYHNDDEIFVKVPASSKGNKLLIKMSPLPQTQYVSGTGWQAIYSMLGAFIKVAGSSAGMKATNMLSVAQGSSPAQVSPTLDFSDTFSPSNGWIKIIIKKINYDYYCFLLGVCSPFYTVVQEGHPWKLQLSIGTDDTKDPHF